MAQEPSSVEQAISRALRDNLTVLQRQSEELQQALSDLMAACSSSRPTNALPSTLRAQTSAASLAASLEVLARFITGSFQPIGRAAADAIWGVAGAPGVPAVGSAAAATPGDAGREMGSEGGPVPHDMVPPPPPISVPEPPPIAVMPPPPPPEPEAVAAARESAEVVTEFDVKALSNEEQEMHRRANRVAKVSMQDIKMLRPGDVKLGRENKDLCARLRSDIDKARKEYDRRFRSILEHPVDYFYDWMVVILADGDPKALGEYPYPSPVLRR